MSVAGRGTHGQGSEDRFWDAKRSRSKDAGEEREKDMREEERNSDGKGRMDIN